MSRPFPTAATCTCAQTRGAACPVHGREPDALSTGTWRPFVDAQPAREHVQAIRDSGMSVLDIARLTGVNRGSIDHLLWGSPPVPPATKIRPETAEALLNFWPTLDDYNDRALIDPTGTLRRVRALATVGWTWTGMAQYVEGWCRSTFERLDQKERVTASLARAVRDMYDEVSGHPAERYGITPWIAERARTRARRAGWPDPTFWEDYGGIDDPNAPETEPAQTTPRYLALYEDWLWLERQGYTRRQAAERLGVDYPAFERAIIRGQRVERANQQQEAA